MQLRSITLPVTTWLLASVLATSSAAAEPVLTNTPGFRLPFTVESDDGRAVDGYAVLFGARNGGAMRQLDRVPVSAGGFQFTAPADGTWQFAIRMTDPAGNPDESAGPLTPELQVIVDTTPPTLELELIDAGEGNVRVNWSSTEDFVPGALKLMYSEGADGGWKPLSVTPSTLGQTTIRSRPGTVVAVRAQLADRANNTGTVSRKIMLSAAPEPHPVSRSQHGSAWNEISGTAPSTIGSPVGPSPFPQLSTASVSQSPLQPQTNYSDFPPAAHSPRLTTPKFSGPPTHSTQTRYPSPKVPAGPSRSTIPPAQPWQVIGSQPVLSNPAMSGQLVSDSVFNLAYTVEDVGPSGVSAVEFFLTPDNGQQWFRYENDTDLQSPMQVDVQGEGTFGFAIRVRNGVGFIDPPPQPGERPEIIVTVDRRAPTVDLAIPQVRVSGSASVILGWKVEDSQSSTTVRLEWATSAKGPWVPVFDWQADRGGYSLPVSPEMPHSLYFRLLARDAAGNIGSGQTSQPALIDLKRPKARMIGVHSASQRLTY